jgi:hypothetical protein
LSLDLTREGGQEEAKEGEDLGGLHPFLCVVERGG